MDARWEIHNRHRSEGPDEFERQDPTLRRLAQQPLIHESRLIAEIARQPPGIYTLGGGRQVGKTTFVKQLMADLMRRCGIPPPNVAYFTGEVFVDEEDLRRTLTDVVAGEEGGRAGGVRYVFVDEVTYVRGWDRTVKFLADAGLLERVVLLLTGSDLILIQDALTRLPGRRGPADRVDYHYWPLDFEEFCRLRARIPASSLDPVSAGRPADPLPRLPPEQTSLLEEELRQYHRTGGYLSAINDLEAHGSISIATLRTYSDWIRGDMVRQGRSETYLGEVLRAILDRYTTQVTWNALARELSIDHPSTVADYCAVLARMDAVLVVPALREDRLTAAPKKARKIYFTDPFIYHAVRAYLGREDADRPAPYPLAPIRNEGELAQLVEASVLGHLARFAPTYYLKAEGEVDAAYVQDGRFWPIEVKWTRPLRPKDLKQVLKYPNAVIAGRVADTHELSGVPVVPAPAVLLRLSGGGSRRPDPVGR